MRRRALAWGLAAAAVYLATAIGFAGDGPVLPLYEAVPINTPYRWVNPPEQFAAGNIAPESTTQEVAMTDGGTVSASIVTPDGQGAIVVRDGAFAPRLNEIAVMVKLEPLDPEKVDEPPAGVRYDGNAYRITATYAEDGTPATLAVPGTVVLRSPLGGTRLLRHEGTGWSEIGDAQPVAASLQVFGETPVLGTFVAGQTIHAKPFPWLPVSLGASAFAIGAGYYAASKGRARKRRASRPVRRQQKRSGPAQRSPRPKRRGR